MIHLGKVDLAFSVQTQSMDVSFDPVTQQQVITFKFGVSISLPQMLQQLQKFQFREGLPLDSLGVGGAPGLTNALPAPPVSAPSSMPGPARQPGFQQQASLEGVQPVVIPPTSNSGSQVHKMWDPSKGQRLQQPLSQSGGQAPLQAPLSSDKAQRLQQPLSQSGGQMPLQAPLSSDGTMMVPPDGAASAASASLPLNSTLVEGLRENNITKVQGALQHGADVNCVEAPPHFRTPLHHALEAGGSLEIVSALLQAKANVNTAAARGKTPLHFAIQQYASIPPIVIRMLLCWKADLQKPDARGTTPLQTAKLVAMHLHTQQDSQTSAADNVKVRQLLNEVTEQPTVAVVVVDAKEVKRVLFADTENDKLVFHTESSVGLYSLKNRRMIFIKKLRQLQVVSSVQHVSVNPCLGTIAVCLSIADTGQGEAQSLQNVTIVWPNGHLQDEEPLKLTLKVGAEGAQRQDLLPPCVTLSRGQGPQMLLSRLLDGQVFCWRLNSARSQLMSEVKLQNRGGLMATSDDGNWIAVVNMEDENKEHLEVWAFENLSRPNQNPKHLLTLPTRPVALAILQQPAPEGGQASCLLAAVEAGGPGMPQPPIEILSIGMDGSMSVAYRIQSRSLCHTLDFCGTGSDLHLLSGHVDGLAIVCRPATGEISMSHDSPGIRNIAISTDHKLMASVENNYMRVYKAPAPDPQ